MPPDFSSARGGSKIGNRLSGFSFARKDCFWCRMRKLGKDQDDEDDEEVMLCLMDLCFHVITFF